MTAPQAYNASRFPIGHVHEVSHKVVQLLASSTLVYQIVISTHDLEGCKSLAVHCVMRGSDLFIFMLSRLQWQRSGAQLL